MTFKELLNELTWQQIEDALINLYDEYNLEGYMSVVQKLSNMIPKESNMRIIIKWVPPDDIIDEGYWDVHGKNGTLHKDTEDVKLFPNASEEFLNSEVTYALEFMPWNEWLGMNIDEETINNMKYSKADIVAHILYELTFISFDEEKIQNRINEIKKQADEIKI